VPGEQALIEAREHERLEAGAEIATQAAARDRGDDRDADDERDLDPALLARFIGRELRYLAEQPREAGLRAQGRDVAAERRDLRRVGAAAAVDEALIGLREPVPRRQRGVELVPDLVAPREARLPALGGQQLVLQILDRAERRADLALELE